jgi:cellulose synthase/poly-beta-1,6-N-acetylglucosamine synthase-like glycosyltransferase
MAATLYPLAFVVAAHFYRDYPERSARARLLVLVPAHDEELWIARAVNSLLEQEYPRPLFRVVVIADNCSDQTASVARYTGAEVMTRVDLAHPGKGPALSWAIDVLSAGAGAPDAFVVVDADSIADPKLLQSLADRFIDGALAVQADYVPLTVDAHSPPQDLRHAAILLFNRGRSRGREALHLPAGLLGNGMLISRRALAMVPWSAYSPVEDLEFGLLLRMRGINPRFTGRASVKGPLADNSRAATTQRLRWEGGRFFVLRKYGLKLLGAGVTRRDLSLVEAALDLAVPPLALTAMLATSGLAVTALAAGVGVVSWWCAVTWGAAVLAVFALVGVGLPAAEAPREDYMALLHAPAYLVWKLGVYARLARGFDSGRWERTARPADASGSRTG